MDCRSYRGHLSRRYYRKPFYRVLFSATGSTVVLKQHPCAALVSKHRGGLPGVTVKGNVIARGGVPQDIMRVMDVCAGEGTRLVIADHQLRHSPRRRPRPLKPRPKIGLAVLNVLRALVLVDLRRDGDDAPFEVEGFVRDLRSRLVPHASETLQRQPTQ